MGVELSPSILTARWSHNGANVRVGRPGKASEEIQSIAASFEDLHNKYLKQQEQINLLENQNFRRHQAEDEMRDKLKRIHKVARRFLLHFARGIILETHDHTRSLTDTEWQALKGMSNEEMDTKLGYGRPEEMGILRPTSEQHEDQIAAAHVFQMNELLSAVEDLDDGPERNLCSWILNLVAGHKLV